MSEQENDHQSKEWVTVKDDLTGLQVDFPRSPLEMTFDLPFKNTPPAGKIHLYSVPNSTGVLVLSTLTSPEIAEDWLEEERLKHFFDQVLVPHLFYNPKIFYDHQSFKYSPRKMNGHSAAAFQISYQDHNALKNVEGIAVVKDQSLLVYFYLASEKDFDHELMKQFMDSVQF